MASGITPELNQVAHSLAHMNEVTDDRSMSSLQLRVQTAIASLGDGEVEAGFAGRMIHQIDTDPDSYNVDNSVTTDDVAGADTSGDGEPAEA